MAGANERREQQLARTERVAVHESAALDRRLRGWGLAYERRGWPFGVPGAPTFWFLSILGIYAVGAVALTVFGGWWAGFFLVALDVILLYERRLIHKRYGPTGFFLPKPPEVRGC